jgi:hypothetical protein
MERAPLAAGRLNASMVNGGDMEREAGVIMSFSVW